MTKKGVYEYLQKMLGTTSDAEIARQLAIEDRQKIKQWADGRRQNDITTAIMSLLITELERRNATDTKQA
mgnify:FL=1